VLIDDVDNANFSLAGLNVLREIMDARHEAKKRTLVTSNCNPSELKARFAKVYGNDDAAQSLLERLRPYHAMKFQGESFRKSL
jgi:DNA replication protein DnaC